MDPTLTVVVCTVTSLQKAALKCNKNCIILPKGDTFEMRKLSVEMRLGIMTDNSICSFICYHLISCFSTV